jgi:transcriptional/translational regulatory protein YebC/TACO1
VSYNFTRKGVVLVPKTGTTEDDLMMLALEAGAEDVNDAGDNFEVVTEASDLIPVRKALQDGGVDYESAEASFIPSMSIDLDAEGARKVFRLIDALEDSDDVQNVWANFDVTDEVMAQLDED